MLCRKFFRDNFEQRIFRQQQIHLDALEFPARKKIFPVFNLQFRKFFQRRHRHQQIHVLGVAAFDIGEHRHAADEQIIHVPLVQQPEQIQRVLRHGHRWRRAFAQLLRPILRSPDVIGTEGGRIHPPARIGLPGIQQHLRHAPQTHAFGQRNGVLFFARGSHSDD